VDAKKREIMDGFHLCTLASTSIVSCFCTLCFVPILSLLATKIGLIDIPDGKIKKHSKPIPYLGGVAVYGGFLFGLLFSFSFTSTTLFLVVGTTPFLVLGLLDDIAPLKPSNKFFGQFVIATFLLCASIQVKEQFFHTYWCMPLFVFWILTMVNALNLIDVMDGLATVVALGAVGSFLTIALMQHTSEIAVPLAAFGGSLFGFLWYNRPPARIYLGDAGALWIGGFLSIIPLFFGWSLHNVHGYLAPIFILSIPLLEVASLIVIRSYKKLPFYLGSPHHFCHYLQSNGWSKRFILFYVAIISVILNGVACLYVQGIITLPVLLGISFSLLGVWVCFLTLKP
jgi:UDP-GlcNAc:undecaprenyl-phosphate GlcNAc-1-phosphate transferase